MSELQDGIDDLDKIRASNKRSYIGKWATHLSGKTMRFVYLTKTMRAQDDEVTQFLVDLENIAGRMFDDAIATECPG